MGGKPKLKDVDTFFDVVQETKQRVKGPQVEKGVSDSMETLSER